MGEETKRGGDFPENLEKNPTERLVEAINEVERIGDEIKRIFAEASNARAAKEEILKQDEEYNNIRNSFGSAIDKLKERFLIWQY